MSRTGSPPRAGPARADSRRVVAGALALGALASPGLSACATWQRRDLPVAGVATPAPPTGRLRVTRTDQSTLVLTHALVTHDSVVGDAGAPPARVAVALRDVYRLDERHVSPVRTGGLVLGGAVVGGVLLLGAAVAAVLAGWH